MKEIMTTRVREEAEGRERMMGIKATLGKAESYSTWKFLGYRWGKVKHNI